MRSPEEIAWSQISFFYNRAGSATDLVARWVRVVSAARRVITWRVISTGRSSTEGGGADGSTYGHSRTYTTIIATAVNTTAIDATTIDATTIDATTIVCGRVS
jgi:hypothetical protein